MQLSQVRSRQANRHIEVTWFANGRALLDSLAGSHSLQLSYFLAHEMGPAPPDLKGGACWCWGLGGNVWVRGVDTPRGEVWLHLTQTQPAKG